MKGLLWLLLLLLALLGAALALLALGTFSSINPDAPLWLQSLGSLAGLLQVRLGLETLPVFTRALALTVLASFVLGLAAYVKPRS